MSSAIAVAAAIATTTALTIRAIRSERSRSGAGRGVASLGCITRDRARERRDDELVEADAFGVGPRGQLGVQRLWHAQQQPAAV